MRRRSTPVGSGPIPRGDLATPVLYREGEGAYNHLDDQGRNRWGDYSYTALDPVDPYRFFTIQEHTHLANLWGTCIAEVYYEGPQFVTGDMDCDDDVDFDDIDPFVLALNGQAGYEAQYPDCNWMNADCDDDGQVNFADIDAFVALLTG